MISSIGKIILFMCFALFFAVSPANAAEKKDAYAIQDVPVTVKAANPAAAKDSAIEEAQFKAFRILSDKILPPAASDTASMLDKKIILSFVRDFSVRNERTSATEYRAVFTVRFYENKVKQFFAERGVTVNEIREIRVLVIPVLQVGQRSVVWEDPNPWLEAWKQTDIPDNDNITVAVPEGDIPDVQSIPDIGVFSKIGEMTDAFKGILDRYGADELFFVIIQSKGASMDPGQGATVSLYKYNSSDKTLDSYTPLDIQADPSGFSKAVDAVVSFLRKDWKKAQTASASVYETGTETETGGNAEKPTDISVLAVTVRYPIRTLRDWIVMKEKMSKIDKVVSAEVLQLNKSYVDLSLKYSGTADELNIALEQNCGAALVPSNGYGAGAAPSDSVPVPQYILQVPETGNYDYRY